MKGTLLLICLGLCIGCANVQVQRLPAYDYAMQMGGPDRPKLFSADTVKINNALTPYAVIVATGARSVLDRSIWRKAAEFKADVVIIKDGGSQYAGTTSTAMPMAYGGAVAFSSPVYQTSVYGYCFRLNPVTIGFETDQTNMIIKITNDNIRLAGILEGDKLIAIDGINYSQGMPELLKLKEGQQVLISVVRPGVGKIDKIVKTMENKPTYLEYSDAIVWKDLPQPNENESKIDQ